MKYRYLLSFILIAINSISGVEAQGKGSGDTINAEDLKIKEIVKAKKPASINSHGLPSVKEDQIDNILSQATTVLVIEELDRLVSHSYEKLIQRSAFDKKLYLVYSGGISGTDKHVFGPLVEK